MASEKLRRVIDLALDLQAPERDVLLAALRGQSPQSFFWSSWAKLLRAREQRQQLEAEIDAYLAVPENCAPVEAQLDPTDGCYAFKIVEVPYYSDFLKKVSLVLGEAANNLRAALDHAVFQLVSRASKPMNETHAHLLAFPICSKRGEYMKKAATMMNGMGDAQKVVIENYQPFHGQGYKPDGWQGAWIHPFQQLKELTNHDKHRGMLVTCLLPNGLSMELLPGVHVANEQSFTPEEYERMHPFRFNQGRLEVGAEVMRCRLVSPAGEEIPHRFTRAGRVAPSVAMTENRSPIAVLDRIEHHVARVITELDISLN